MPEIASPTEIDKKNVTVLKAIQSNFRSINKTSQRVIQLARKLSVLVSREKALRLGQPRRIARAASEASHEKNLKESLLAH